MKNLSLLFLAFSALMLPSCSTKSAEEVMDGLEELFDGVTPIVRDANDVASAKVAVEKLDEHLEKIDAYMAEHEDVKITEEESKANSERLGKVGEQMGMDCMVHINTLRAKDPAAAKILQDGFMKFLSGIQALGTKYK